MGAADQFILLLWKNWLLQKRKPILTVLEIGIPAVVALIFLGVRELVSTNKYETPRVWDSYSINGMPSELLLNDYDGKWRLAYSPANPATDSIVERLKINLNLSQNVLSFDTEDDLLSFFADDINSTATWGGIIFNESSFNGSGHLEKNVTYTIRPEAQQSIMAMDEEGLGLKLQTPSLWMTNKMFPVFESPGPRYPEDIYGGFPYYYNRGFLAIQKALDYSIMMEHNAAAEFDSVQLRMERFSYPPYVDDDYIWVIQNQLPFMILLSFIVTAPNICKDLVLEKEKRLKEFMKMMGLLPALHWLAWFVKYFMFLLISVTFITVIFIISIGENGAVLNFIDPSVLFVFFMLYAIASILFCFAVSVFFKKANTGAAAGGILFFLNYVPYLFVANDYDMPLGSRLALSLFHNVAMSYGCFQIGRYEGTGAGLQWSNVMKPVTVDDDFTMGHVFLMLIVDSLICIFIVWYFDNIMPGDYGIPQPWFFPLTKSYWCGISSKISDEECLTYTDKGGEYFEPDPTNLNAGIQIKNLRKVFKRSNMTKVAVEGTSLNMYEGQITALLGHNGAGKTTTMSMLTGFLPPTSGTALVNGHDIRKDIVDVRESLGLCPQHDVLFGSLTVREHLIFFSKLKGLKKEYVNQEVMQTIKLLKLEDKTNIQSDSLSGGMKRKLSVGIALCAGSKIVILDEPTSGMDPEARRQTWDILQSERSNRTMVLSTHFMDEADLLGDRIAIMADGAVKCCGSSLFLKGKFGVGYHMVMVKGDNCMVETITETITKFVPQCKLENNNSSELSYILPTESSPNFENLFLTIEKRKVDLGISSFGASVTTMEEVFMKVGESSTFDQETHSNEMSNQSYKSHDDSHELAIQTKDNSPSIQTTNPEGVERSVKRQSIAHINPSLRRALSMEAKWELKPVMGVEQKKNSGFDLNLQQFQAMLIKRMLHTWRNKVVTFSQLLVPLFFTLLSCIVIETFPGLKPDPSLSLGMNNFMDQMVPYTVNSSAGASNLVNGLLSSYKSALSGPYVNDIFNVQELPGFTDKNLTDYIGYIGSENRNEYNRRYSTAVNIVSDDDESATLTAFYNNQALHQISITLNVAANTILKYFVGDNYTITANIFPLPKSDKTAINDNLTIGATLAFIVSTNVLFGMAFLVGSFSVFLIHERVSKSKHIQFVSGVHPFNFWTSTFLWDFINYLIPTLLLIPVFLIFDIKAYFNGQNAGVLVLLFIFYGWSVLPFTYAMSNLFSVPSSGYVWISVFNLFTGIAAVLAVYILKVPALNTYKIAEALEWSFYVILPNFCFGNGLNDIYRNYEFSTTCKSYNMTEQICRLIDITGQSNPCCPSNCARGGWCAPYQDNFLAWEAPGIGRAIIFMTIQGIFWFAAILISESSWANSLLQSALESATSDEVDYEHVHSLGNTREDADVQEERLRIMNTSISRLMDTDSLVLISLRKFYGNFLAVDRLCVGIPQGECFGLLGVNGAGKTTTFKMMTGDVSISSGEAFLDGFSVKKDVKEVQTRLGYCPQFDALIEQMTVRETLIMYARLRGVLEEIISDVVTKMITALTLEKYEFKRAGELSGGNKRKLSTAMALIGDPPVIFLDEPTTGMDPVARRKLWDVLNRVRQSGRTLLLTSHSMEECEALCTRLAIMVNGRFRCLGSTQHLKNKFGEGYTLLVKLATTDDINVEEATHNLCQFIESTFPGSVLKDIHEGYVHYQVQASDVIGWGNIFGTMERAKVEYHIEDYSVSQTTLDQVFLNFARAQVPPRETSPSCSTKCCNVLKFCCGCKCCKSKSIEQDEEMMYSPAPLTIDTPL